MLKTVNTLIVVVMLLSGSLAIAQTNASKTSAVGTWNMDLEQSKIDFGGEPPPKSVTLTIIKDTPEASAWRIDAADGAGKSLSHSWEGPADGTLQPMKGADGQVIGKQSLKRDGDALLRHGELPDGSAFDSRATMSADGNTITDVVTVKSQDGKTSKETHVYRRVTDADRGRK